jgi:hypothetical protein
VAGLIPLPFPARARFETEFLDTMLKYSQKKHVFTGGTTLSKDRAASYRLKTISDL